MSDAVRLAETMIRLGVRHVFGIPGGGPSLRMLDRLEQEGCSFHLVSHEAAGALAAAGCAQAGGALSASVSIKGPGFANLLSGIGQNWMDRTPSLSLSESFSPYQPTSRRHKWLDQARLIPPVVKAYGNNVSPALLPELWGMALEEEPGPVHLDFSDSMPGERLEVFADRPHPGGELEVSARRRLADCKRPVVIAGSLARRRDWARHLERLDIPVFTTAPAKGVVDERLPHAAGVFTNSGGQQSPEQLILPQADLIVGLGLRNSETIDSKRLPAPLLALDELEGQAAGMAESETGVVPPAICEEVLDLLSRKEWGEDQVHRSRQILLERLDNGQWLPAAAFRSLQSELPPDTRFVLDTGNFCTVGEHVLVSTHPGTVLGSFSARSMGVAIPRGIGAALAQEGPWVIVSGDGGVRMYPEMLSLAAHQRLPVLFVLMEDGSFASIRAGASKKGLTQQPLLPQPCRWKSLAGSFGIACDVIENEQQLSLAIHSWDRRSPLFLDLIFDPDLYLTMVEGIR